MTTFILLSEKYRNKQEVLKSAKDLKCPDYMMPSQRHREILRRLTKNNAGKVKEYYSVALEELVLQQGPYKVAAEVSEGKVICYCCYNNQKLLETIYEENKCQ
jgi:hypothetical protein